MAEKRSAEPTENKQNKSTRVDPATEDEHKYVNEYISSTFRLVRVNTNPPLMLQSTFAGKSDALRTLAFTHMKDETAERDKFGNKYILQLPHNDIPIHTWKIISKIVCITVVDFKDVECDDNTLDDIFYIFVKYDINITKILTANGIKVFKKFCADLLAEGQHMKRMSNMIDTTYTQFITDIAYRRLASIGKEADSIKFMDTLCDNCLFLYKRVVNMIIAKNII